MALKAISPWQRIFSYFKPIQLTTQHSEFTPVLEVVLTEGRCMLNSPDATYSFEDKYTSYRTAIHQIRNRLKNYNHILVLGLGLGSVPYMLQTKFAFKGKITCVEIDPVIVSLAKHYYPNKQLLQKLDLLTDDAVHFMEHNKVPFDAIFCDLFIDKRVPAALHEFDFLHHVKRALAPGGTLLFSRLASERQAELTLWENLKQVFPEGEDIDTGGNYILNYQAPITT